MREKVFVLKSAYHITKSGCKALGSRLTKNQRFIFIVPNGLHKAFCNFIFVYKIKRITNN